MTKKHYITIAICSLIILIAGAIFGYYYKEYIAPESYVIGTNKEGEYKDLVFADYYSDEDILFSQNINKSTFSVANNVASYEFNFEHKEFDGVKNSYVLYINDYMLNNITSDAGTISGTYTLNYYDVDKSVLCHSDISINFSFYSLASKLQVSLAEKDLGYLVKFFKTDNFIITLASNPFLMLDKEGEVDEKINEITQLTLKVEELNGTVANLNSSLESKQAELEALKSSNEDKSEEISILEAEVESLKVTIADLKYQVSYYQQLLEAYENPNYYEIRFISENIVQDVQFTNSIEHLYIPEDPIKDFGMFVGWSVDGVNIVDFTNYDLNSSVDFIAIFEDRAGLYDIDNNLIYSWDTLLANGHISITDGILSSFNDGLGGKLILSPDIIEIGQDCFRNSTLLQEVIIGSKVQKIGKYAFSGASSLKFINVPDNVLEIGGSAFSNCTSLNKVDLSDNITVIPDSAFRGCTNLKSIRLPNNLDSIGYRAFNGCESLKSIIIPASVTTISGWAFANCISLKSIYIPSNVINITCSGDYVFSNCSLTIYVEVSSKPSSWSETFNLSAENSPLEVKYGYTYESYLNEIKGE